MSYCPCQPACKSVFVFQGTRELATFADFDFAIQADCQGSRIPAEP